MYQEIETNRLGLLTDAIASALASSEVAVQVTVHKRENLYKITLVQAVEPGTINDATI